MITRLMVVAFFLLVMALPASAQVQYCYKTDCQYLGNISFSNSVEEVYWSYTGGSARGSVTNQCDGGSTYAGVLTNGGTIYQEFNADSSQYRMYWSLEFYVYFASPNGTFYDEVKATVTDLNTNQTEVLYVRASNTVGQCSRVTMNLTRDYSGHRVRVTFKGGSLSAIGRAVDTVTMWSSPYAP